MRFISSLTLSVCHGYCFIPFLWLRWESFSNAIEGMGRGFLAVDGHGYAPIGAVWGE